MKTYTLKKGDKTTQEDAMGVAYCDYEKDLNTYAYFKTNNHALSDDLVQDTFVKTWMYLVKNEKIDSMKAFLYHILRHLIVDEYRKNKPTSLDLLLEKGFEPHATSDYQRKIDILDGEDALLLIAELPPVYQKILRMRYIQDLSLKEISLITGQTRNAVAVQAHRGMEKLTVLYNHTH